MAKCLQNQRQETSAKYGFRSCWLLGIAIGISLVGTPDPGIIADLLSGLKDIEMATWYMLGAAAHACAELVRFVMRSRSG
jgi:hypothetical protein